MFFFNPFTDLFTSNIIPVVVQVITKEANFSNPSFFDIVSNNITIFSSFLSTLTVIVGSIFGAMMWIRKQILKDNHELRKDTKLEVEKLADKTAQSVSEAKTQVQRSQAHHCVLR